MSGVRRQDFVGDRGRLKQVLDDAERAARFDFPILILGETGTGKSKLAEYIHGVSPRADKPFTILDIGAVPGDLLESELFGHVRGAFTGAKAEGKEGLLKTADKGTLFVDEISNASLNVQAKLLRFLQTGMFRPVGSESEVRVDVRIIAATNDKITEAVKVNNFRADLYYRLKNVILRMPALKDQLEVLPELTQHILNDINKKYSTNMRIAPDAIRLMQDHPYDWPGNIRELEGTIKRLVSLSPEDVIDKNIAWEIFQRQTDRPEKMGSFEKETDYKKAIKEFEKDFLIKALSEHSFNKTKTAAAIGMKYKTLMRKIKGIEL